MPQSILFHQLWRGPNVPVVNIPAITMFLAILERLSNSRDDSNGHISSSWQSANLRCSDILAKFQFCKPSFFRVLPGTSYNLSNFSFFLLIFLAFFPEIWVIGFLFPLMFLSPLGMVNSHYGGSSIGFEGSTSSLFGVGVLLSCTNRCFKSSCVLSNSMTRSLVCSIFDWSSCSFSKCPILLAMKSLNSSFFVLDPPLLFSFVSDLSQSMCFLAK
jgi:hypothetical protein